MSSLGELRRMLEQGKLGEADYVFNPVLEKWLYARDVAELRRSEAPPRMIPVDAWVCTNCRNLVDPATRGGFLLECVLWLCFAVPGLIYSVWRRTSPKVCPSCGARVIPALSSGGRRALGME